ncbi:MAG: hypothetical protein DI527_13155 [Chelatococcus sp.]|uniref:MobA/MobL family protein n=1 Tax=Bosea massiliensis TaxID=151419 RepID=A0ABW0P0V5_9HYPH|nr:MAG: hypothetical protein DI527_13155 [Chelatococcus sp.]
MFDRTMHLSTSWVRARAHLGPASAGLVSAYITGGHSFDGHRVNNPHRRREIAMTGLSLPAGIVMTPHELWHWVDRKERRKDGEYQMRSRELPRLASHMRCSLPWALSPEAAERVTTDFARFLTEELGLGVQFAVHNKPEHDWDHAHFLMTTRSLALKNFGKKVRELDGIAMRKREAGTAAEVRYARADGREKTISSTIETMRARWAGLLSAELGYVVDHRSFERRGLDLDPVIYVPRAQIEYEKRQARRGAAGRDWRAERASQLASRQVEAALLRELPDQELRRRTRPAPARAPRVVEIGLRSICQELERQNTLVSSWRAAALTRLAKISPLLALSAGNQILEAIATREVRETAPVSTPSPVISTTDASNGKRKRLRQNAGAGIMSKLFAQHGDDIATAVSASSSQHRIMRDAINHLGRINPIVALGALARMAEITLEQKEEPVTAISTSPSERRAQARRRGSVSGRKNVAGAMATRARQALETECSQIERGHDDANAAQAMATQFADEMKRRERRFLKRMEKKLGYAAMQSAVVHDALVAFTLRLEAYFSKAMEALRERLERHRLERQKIAAQAMLELAALDAIPIDNAMVRLQATAAVAQSFRHTLDHLHTRQAGEVAEELTQWLDGGPNLRRHNATTTLTPNIVSSVWSRPSPRQPERSVARTAAAAPQHQPVARSRNPHIPIAASAGVSKSATQSTRKNIRNNITFDVPAFTEKEEFGLLRPKPASPASANGQAAPRPRASESGSRPAHQRPRRPSDQEIE